MREIKFRYWNSIINQMVAEPEMPYKEGWTIEQLFSDRGWAWQQFTGLKDRNGKEIYEGDIVSYTNITQPVQVSIGGYIETYSEGHAANGVHIHNKEETFVMGVSAFNQDGSLEVIGSIYENPELIK